CEFEFKSGRATFGHWYSTTRVSKRLSHSSAACLRARYHVRQDNGEEWGLNPPNGSWGIVKVQPTPTDNLFLNPPNGSWGIVKVQPSPYGRLDLNDPPTAVGGIRGQCSVLCSLDLNDPPTAAGGIRRTVRSYLGAHGTARVSKRLSHRSAACLRARYCTEL